MEFSLKFRCMIFSEIDGHIRTTFVWSANGELRRFEFTLTDRSMKYM